MSEDKQKMAVDITVPSEDPVAKPKEGPPNSKELKRDEPKVDEISDEDLQLKNELEMLVERLKESDSDLYLPALESLRTLIKTSTSSMTSVPKPLKFLRPFYEELIQIRENWDDSNLSEQKSLLSSIVSVLAMTYSDNGNRDTLHYRMISGSKETPGEWGHEYVRHLAAELGEEYSLILSGVNSEASQAAAEEKSQGEGVLLKNVHGSISNATDARPAATTSDQKKSRAPKSREQLIALALELVPFFLQHNAEADAVDLLLELESIEKLDTEGFLDGENGKDAFQRVCGYMVNCVPLLVPPDDRAFLKTAAAIYAKHERYPEALALAIRLRDKKLIRKYFEGPSNMVMRKQLAFILARAQVPLAWVHRSDDAEDVVPSDEIDMTEEGGEDIGPVPTLPEDLVDCLGNAKVSEQFKNFGKELDVEEPKSLEDVYKTHLEHSRVVTNYDSAKANLAGTFVNAFVNAGFSNDKLVVDVEEGKSFIYKNKDHGMMSATASIGMSMLWNTEEGVSVVDKYTYSAEEHIKAGAFLAIGMLHTSIRPEFDVAYALLEEHVDNQSVPLKVAALNGIALGCAGTERQEIANKLLPYVADDASSMQVAASAALSLAFVYVGSGNADIAITIVQTLMERDEAALSDKWARFFGVALGLIFLGKQDASEATIELLKTIEHPLGKQCELLVDVCSYAGTGNVLKIQQLLHICAEQPKEEEESAEKKEDDKEKEKDAEAESQDMTYQAIAVLGLALIAMGEEVGEQMVLRQFGHLMAYGNATIRKAVPLALGLISASNPQLTIMDSLSKYSHNEDLAVASSAVIGLGLIGAGTNNARLGQLLRGLATYYSKEPNLLFLVRISQGFVNMGKGLIGISPLYNDGTTLHYPSICGLLSVAMSLLNPDQFILAKDPWQLFWLATAMHPSSLHILDENLEEKKIDIRVGQKTHYTLGHGNLGITGAVTNTAPVRVGVTERAVLSTAEYIPYTPVLENIVIVHKNVGYEAED